MKRILFALLILANTALLAACTEMPIRRDIAHRVAAPAFMVERTIPAEPFELTAFERMHTRDAPANIYIEGDGKAWLSKSKISRDPTPTNPVALHLAAYDKADNVGWLARPCQFTKLLDESKPCPNSYWTNKRFAPEVITAYHAALDNIAAKYDITEFNLIGFSGGANIAAILAAQRDDVVSLRTVAGNLDHVAHSNYHKVSILEGSLNAVDYAEQLRNVPQHHFIGGQDNVVPPAILNSYLQALGETPCLRYSFIQEAEHEAGWVDKWPKLLQIPMSCERAADEPAELPIRNFDQWDPSEYSPKRVLREIPAKP